MADIASGAVTFSRTSEPATGEFEDAIVIRTFGKVPSIDQS